MPKERWHTSVGRSIPAHAFPQLLNSIDTEGTFRPERIAEIAERFGGKLAPTQISVTFAYPIQVDPEQACENIAYARAQNSEVNPTLDTLLGSLT